MTVSARPGAVLHAAIDVQGRLSSADPALLALNARAGGAVGEPLAPPALATAVRLARRLGVMVSRAVTIADEEADVECWVRAEPSSDGAVRLSLTGWRETAAWAPVATAAPDGVAGGAAGAPDADWHWACDASLHLTAVSPAAGRRHGFDAFALLGGSITRLFDLDAEGDALLPLLSALAGRAALEDQPARLKVTGAPVLISAVVRPDGAGGFGGLSGSVRMVPVEIDPVADMADGETVAPTPGTAAPGGDLLPQGFTEGLDRALRAPLTRIVAYADSINAQAEGPITDDYVGYAADIAGAGRHLLALVDDLVDLQAIERDDFAPAADPIDLADVARRAAGLLSVRASNGGVTIARPGFADTVPATGDFRRTLQILVNLLGNAVRYSPEGATVTIVATVIGDGAQVVVADTGKGIAAEDQARVFDKFERVDTSEAGGSGLGLFIARRLARAMGGDLSLESAPGEGARFTLELPGR